MTASRLTLTIIIIMFNLQARADNKCSTTLDCAQVAVEAAARSEAAIKVLQERLDAAEVKNSQARAKIDIVVTKSAAGGADGGTAPNLVWGGNDVQCPPGSYVSGVKLAWRGTCKHQCDGDGGILGGLTLICKSLQ